jgi:hypothetical protein
MVDSGSRKQKVEVLDEHCPRWLRDVKRPPNNAVSREAMQVEIDRYDTRDPEKTA